MKLLLINPKFPESFWSLKLTVDKFVSNKRTVNPPLGLATLAAMCPDDWEIEIVDENIESIPLEPEADIIGICGMGVQFERQTELIKFYKSKGHYVVSGGSYSSLCPEEYHETADTVIAGEAEYIWKEFCRDFEAGKPKMLYKETGEVSLEDSPTPRFDLINVHKYQAVSMQFSRGCPFRCEFCDIIVMFGRKPRTKSMEQIGKELDILRELHITNVFFVDDNFIGNKILAKKLLRYLKEYQEEHNYDFKFGTEASLNMAQDDELLELLRAANFAWVFIGIESPDEASLKETKKFQNTRKDIMTSVHHIYAYGIDILAGFIIGFDNDTVKTFDLQYKFIMKSGIQASMIGLLTAIPKTPLYDRLKEEGRLRDGISGSDNTKLATNIIPKGMNYDEMVHGYRELYSKLLKDENIAERTLNKRKSFGTIAMPAVKLNYGFMEMVGILSRVVRYGVFKGGLSRTWHFFRTIPFTKPKMINLFIRDWIWGMTLKDYFDRHFIEEHEKSNQLLPRYLGTFQKTFQRYLNKGVLEVSLNQVKNAASNISFSFKGRLEKDFFSQASQQIEGLLRNTTSSVTLYIDDFHESQRQHLHSFLNSLSNYGDRIYIKVHERLRGQIYIDSSVFNLVLN